jgi:N-methylhydantoinase B
MSTTREPTGLRLDVLTFEILRHRLWYVNDEGALTISRLSGSPVATEVYDMNTGLMTADGDIVYIDTFICAQATTLSHHVKFLLKEFGENPGFGEQDLFVCNDPYVSVCHQNCVQVVGPVFWEGEIVAWTGASLHVIDVGGPTAGQAQLDAQNIYGEQPLIGPIKIAADGRILKDVERTYLRNSRLPELLALDLRAKLAAVDVSRRRLQETFAEFGAEKVMNAMEDIVDYTEQRMRARLLELPDGQWKHRGFIEFNENVYDCHVTLTKEGDHLNFDYSETADQAPALINCAEAGLIGGVLASTMVYLCWDIPWSPAGVSRVLTVDSRHGSVVNAKHPAGVSKSTTAAIWEVRNLGSIAIGKMLAASVRHRNRAMAGWQGSQGALEELFGLDATGQAYGGPMLDGMAGGGGAMPHRDGIDTGGHTSSLRIAVADVESYELRYPVLYLYRKQMPDSGGAGKFRGGAGIGMLYTVHGVDEIPTKIMHTFGSEQPESPGLCGGYPSTTNQFQILRNTDVHERFAAGEIPQSLGELEGELEAYGAYGVTSQKAGDVYRTVAMGGGGYGDPIDRDPERVLRDVESSLVTPEWAGRMYGVVLRDGGTAVDVEATEAQRETIRAERRKASGHERSAESPALWDPDREGVRLSEALYYDVDGATPLYRCRCGHVLGSAEASFKQLAAFARFPVQHIGPEVDPYDVGKGRFEAREFYCPCCWTLLNVEIAQPDDPIIDDARLSSSWLERATRERNEVTT